MLTVAEEVLLLMLDYDTGRLNAELPRHAVHNAVGGAVLMDLSLYNRIDTDLESLFVVDSQPVGEPLPDQILKSIVEIGDRWPTSRWLKVLADDGESLLSQLMGRLIARGIIVPDKHDRLLVMGVGRGLCEAMSPERDVRKRLGRVLLCGGIPDPRDIMVIGLANACGLWRGLIEPSALDYLKPKIEQISTMDLIGREVGRAIRARQHCEIEAPCSDLLGNL